MSNSRYLLVFALFVVAVSTWWLWNGDETDRGRGYVVGIVGLTDVDASTLAGFKQGMAERGYVEGQNISYLNPGAAVTIDKLDAIAQSHVANNVDLIFVSSTPATLAVKRATQNARIPVVFAPVNDPVDTGIVASLKRPGGNITGIKLPHGDGLRLQMLQQLVPGVRYIYLPYNPEDESAQISLREVQQAAMKLGVELVLKQVKNQAEITQALRSIPDEVNAIFLPRDSSVESRIDDIVAESVRRNLPVAAPSQLQVEAGALLSYGFVHYEIGRQAARLADQIFSGVVPGDIAVEVAENYLVISLKAANMIGIDIPNHILRQADRIYR